MSVLAHFLGGLLDGTSMELPDAPTIYYVPKAPALVWTALSGGEPITLPESYRYMRDEKPVVDEAFYRIMP